VTFSVYGRGVDTLQLADASTLETDPNDEAKKLRKASIEVTHVLGDNASAATILDDRLDDPITKGDNVFTPAWRPGERLQFALVGKMDFDGDGVSDRETLRSMIRSNGGEIVFEVLDNGSTVGDVKNISPTTQFLVMGANIDETTNETVRKGYQDALAAAESFGVRQVYAKDLLAYTGWKGADRIVRLGGGAASVTDPRSTAPPAFRPRQPGGVTPAASNVTSPPANGVGTATPGTVRPMPMPMPVDNSDPFGTNNGAPNNAAPNNTAPMNPPPAEADPFGSS
jgi:hypothetical protein